MVDIHITDASVVITPRGWHKLWTLHGPIHVDRTQIVVVERAGWPTTFGEVGLRLPGTAVPGVILAGSYRNRSGWTFYDIVRKRNSAIALTLRGHRFARIVVDVDDPAAEVDALAPV